MITSDQFFTDLRSALNHLYDPYFLRKSPLIRVFGLENRPDAPSALQHILNEGIARLEPPSGVSQQAQRRKNYELIMYRYVQQFSQEEVANQLGLSVRHLRREQNGAIYTLAADLWEQYQLGARPFQMDNPEGEESAADLPAADSPAADLPAAESSASDLPAGLPDEDLRWLKESLPLEPADLQRVLADVLDLTRPLAERYNNQFLQECGPDLPGLAVQEVALRQLLLNILSVSVRIQTGSRITIHAALRQSQVEIRVEAASLAEEAAPGQAPAACRPLSADEQASLHFAARIADLYGGSLSHTTQPAPCSVTVLLPAFRRRSVLVIDDNLDFHQLVERSLTGSHYQVFAERSPHNALQAAERNAPDIILLDVMMPEVDGWEVLGRLRRHPGTAQIPVIICTILPQEELALSLGASDFLRKPITQAQILSALDRQLALLEQGSR